MYIVYKKYKLFLYLSSGRHLDQNEKPVRESGKSVHSLSESTDSGVEASGMYAPGMSPVLEADSQNGMLGNMMIYFISKCALSSF